MSFSTSRGPSGFPFEATTTQPGKTPRAQTRMRCSSEGCCPAPPRQEPRETQNGWLLSLDVAMSLQSWNLKSGWWDISLQPTKRCPKLPFAEHPRDSMCFSRHANPPRIRRGILGLKRKLHGAEGPRRRCSHSSGNSPAAEHCGWTKSISRRSETQRNDDINTNECYGFSHGFLRCEMDFVHPQCGRFPKWDSQPLSPKVVGGGQQKDPDLFRVVIHSL